MVEFVAAIYVLMIIGAVCFVIALIYEAIKSAVRSVNKKRFEIEAKSLLPLINPANEQLDELFDPKKVVASEDIEKFISNNNWFNS